jgi:hypothetical protein
MTNDHSVNLIIIPAMVNLVVDDGTYPGYPVLMLCCYAAADR